MALPRVGSFFSENRALAFEFCSFFSSALLKGLLGGNGTRLETACLAAALQIIVSVKNATKARFLYMLSMFEAVPTRSWKSRSPKRRFDRLTRWNGPLPAGCLMSAFGAAPHMSAVGVKRT